MLRRADPLMLLLAVALTACAASAQEASVRERGRAAARIAGRVVDGDGRAVGKVKISLGGKVVAESAADGSFSVAPPRAESRVALTFAADGYVSNTRVYDPRATGNGSTVVIWPVAYRVKFDPARELDMEFGSSRINVPANALAAPGGGRPDGPAVLSFTLLDVTSRAQRAAAPGDFSGRMADGSVRRLNSYGVFDLGLRDTRGRPLSLNRGARIGLSVAVPASLAGRAPRQVGFFDFDERDGRWVQVGTFEYNPRTLTYNGSVTSFGGAHNLDDPQDTTCVTVQVVSVHDGAGMPNFSVTAHGQQYDSYGTTDGSGFVCLLVQRNSTFTVEASGSTGPTTYWGTPNPPTFASPNFSSGAADCGNGCTTCPLVGTVQVDIIVGIGDNRRRP